MSEIQAAIKDYLDYLNVEKNRSPATRRNYQRCLERFIKQANIKSVDNITERSIHDFRASLASA
ncbi:MAG: site-specific integrase [Candidatus Colwellbacteria bacterium]|nr:site-specific integrase [Candidatus Colwellbacteria bacterium]